MNSSAEIDKLATALIAAKKEFLPALKTAYNPHYKSNYVDLSGVTQATDTALAKHDLVLIQSPGIGQSISVVSVTSRLMHSSGQWIEGTFEIPATGQSGRLDAQTSCGAVTYARRYSYMGILGIAPEDKDGNDAADRQEVKQEVREVRKSQVEAEVQPDSEFFADDAPPVKKNVKYNAERTASSGKSDTGGTDAISEGKAKRFWAIALGAGKSKEEISSALATKGLSDIKLCPWRGDTYTDLCEWAAL